MEDGQTLFDYNVGLNDIVQLLIRSQTDAPDSPGPKDSSGVACGSASPPDCKVESSPASVPLIVMETSTKTDNESRNVTTSTINEAKQASKSDTSATINSSSTKNGFKPSSPAQDPQPPTSSRNTLIDPGIGVYKVRMC